MTGTGMIITPEQMHKLKYLCDVSVPLLSTDWQGTAAPYTIQVDWPGMTDRDMPEIWLVPSGDAPTDAELAAARLITPSTGNGHLLFSATSKPVTSITARVTGVPISGEFTAANMASLVAKVDQLNTGLEVEIVSTGTGYTLSRSGNTYTLSTYGLDNLSTLYDQISQYYPDYTVSAVCAEYRTKVPAMVSITSKTVIGIASWSAITNYAINGTFVWQKSSIQ